MKNLIKGVTLILLIFTSVIVDAQVINIDWTNSGNSTKSNELVEKLIYDKTDLTEEELQHLDLESVNEYLSNYYYALNKQKMPEGYSKVENEYSFFESPTTFFKKASEIELFNLVNGWVGENSTIEDVRTKLRKSKTEILRFKNGAELYVTLDYSLQLMKVNNTSFGMKISGPECTGNLIKGTIAGAALGTFIPVVGNVTGALIGFCIASTTSACEIDGWW
jgi:hypothetical protein